MKKVTVVVACLFLLVACTSQQDKNEKAFIDNIKAIDNNAEVSLNDITPFEWDMVYSFAPYTSKEKVQETIGFKANVSETVNEGMPHLVFVENKEVVCEIIGYPSNIGMTIHTLSNSISVNDNVVFKVENISDIVCLSEKTTDLTEEEIWSAIENKEWSTYEEGFAGYGIYFYKENDMKYAFSMAYGSGLAVISAYKSEVRIKDNMVYFDFPTELKGGNMGVREIGIIFKDENLYIGDKKLEYDLENPAFHYKEWLKFTEGKNASETN